MEFVISNETSWETAILYDHSNEAKDQQLYLLIFSSAYEHHIITLYVLEYKMLFIQLIHNLYDFI